MITCMSRPWLPIPSVRSGRRPTCCPVCTPNLPTDIAPTNIA